MKKKVLVVIQLLRRGGIEIAAVNFASHLNKDKYEITYYLQNADEGQDEDLVQSVLNSGAKIIVRDHSKQGYVSGLKDAVKIMKKNKYDIVHSHVVFYNGIIMLAAKISGIKKRIAHSHARMWNRKETLPFKLYRFIMRIFINAFATDKLACSTAAGCYMFGKKAFEKHGQIILNGIETKKYAFTQATREKKRQELGITGSELLIGHIGSVYKIKNQVFLTEIFSEMLKSEPNMELMLAGEKFDSQPVEKKAKELGIDEKIRMPGQRNDISELLQAFDILIFPSLVEALPVALIEAQAAKLPCLVSDRVTSEVKFNENVEFMPLEESAEKWAQKAFALLAQNREKINITQLTDHCDIYRIAQKLDKIYTNGANGNGIRSFKIWQNESYNNFA